MFSFLVLFFPLYFWFDSLLLEDSDWWYKSECEVVGHNLTQAAAGSYYVFVATLHLYVINTFDVQFYVNMKLLVWFGRFPAFALSGLHTWHVTCWFWVVAVLLLGCKQVFTEWLNYGCFPFYLNALSSSCSAALLFPLPALHPPSAWLQMSGFPKVSFLYLAMHFTSALYFCLGVGAVGSWLR